MNEHCIFTDGDCWVEEGSLRILIDALETNLEANAAAAVNAAARGPAVPWTFNGNLYALRSAFVGRLRNSGYRMPRGLVGDDSNVGHLVLINLDASGKWDFSRSVVCSEARLFADRLNPLTPAYWLNQHSRRLRYSRRYFENMMMNHVIVTRGLQAIPSTVDDLYTMASQVCRLKWQGVNTPYDCSALQLIRSYKKGSSDVVATAET